MEREPYKIKENDQEFEQRMIDETLEINNRRTHLSSFIKSDKFKSLSGYHQGLLIKQSVFMEAYQKTVEERLLDLGVFS